MESTKFILKKPMSTTETKSGKMAIENKLISQKSIDLLNYRIQQEEESSRLYEDMHLYLKDNGYNGAAGLWSTYSKEELTHAGWAKTYLLSLGIQPKLSSLKQPSHDYDGLVDIINKSYTHEVDILNQCKELAMNANKECDFMLYELSLRYIKEQTEELDKLQNWIDQISSFGSDKIALRLLDVAMAG
jgi:ferritin